MRFRDRTDAGNQLADELRRAGFDRPVVLALPRGGVSVATPVASSLGAPLEVFVARKIGAPGQPELGIGAIAEGLDTPVWTPIVWELGLSRRVLESLAERERVELDRRVQCYRQGRPLVEILGQDVILVDDGLATGVTAEAALRALRGRDPHRLVLAVPVCAPDAADRLRTIADEVVWVQCPPDLHAVGAWYDHFDQISDADVLAMLDHWRQQAPKD